jgi:hypothetical protein
MNRFSGPYRQSLLKLYSECPRKFKLLNVDGIDAEKEKSVPLIVGSNVHRLIDLFHLRQPIDWHRSDIPFHAWEQIKELVNVYTKHNRGIEVMHSEVRFEFPINGYTITGTIDLVYRDEHGRIVLRDIKTDATEPSADFLARDIQFSIYYLGAIQGLGIQPDVLEWYHLRNLVPYKRTSTRNGVQYKPGEIRGDPSFIVMRRTEDISTIEKEIRCMIQGIRFNIFPMRPLKIGHMCPCNYCEVREYCQPRGQIVEQLADFEGLHGYEQFF